jgi:hypothetical protein
VPESAKLTVKVTLHPAPLPTELPQTESTVVWSVPRLSLALLLLLVLLAFSWWGLAEPARPRAAATQMAASSSMAPPLSGLAQLPTSTAATSDAVSPAGFAPVTAQLTTVLDAKGGAATGAPSVSSSQAALAEPQSGLPAGFSRIVFTARMERLEPGVVQQSPVLQSQVQRLYLFTELRGYAGQQLRHRWFYQQQLQTEAVLTIEDSPWRTYSEKWLLPDQLGPWRVQILDQAQNVLYQHDFQYQ